MPLALKAQWVVTAGVIPGQIVDDYTRVWHYTSRDYAKDADPSHAETSIFVRMMNEASVYALSITDPVRVNWVKNDFMWI